MNKEKAKKLEQDTVEVPRSQYENLMQQMSALVEKVNVLSANQNSGQQGAVNLLKTSDVEHEVDVAVFFHEDRRFLMVGFGEKVLANGARESVTFIKRNVETGEEFYSVDVIAFEIDDNNKIVGGEDAKPVSITMDYKTFFYKIQPVTVVLPKECFKKDVIEVNYGEVEQVRYEERKGEAGQSYIQQVGTGVMVKLNSDKVTAYIETNVFGKNIIIQTSALNLKR